MCNYRELIHTILQCLSEYVTRSLLDRLNVSRHDRDPKANSGKDTNDFPYSWSFNCSA